MQDKFRRLLLIVDESPFFRTIGRNAGLIMKTLRICAVVATVFVTNVVAYAEENSFHNGGTGDCQGCHTEPPQLIGSDAGSTCLICHQAPVGVTLPSKQYVASDARTGSLCFQLPQGGDFCWLKKDYKWSPSGVQGFGEDKSPGERHGHNIVARDYEYEPDSTLQYAPGGTYPSFDLSCISCHDPHGNYRRLADGAINTAGPPIIASGSYSGSPEPSSNGAVGTYRLLAGKGYKPKSSGGVPVFTADPPAAVTPLFSNRAETNSDTRIAYGSGMSEWCQNCHLQFSSSHTHPVGMNARLTNEVTNTYNNYLYSGNLSGRAGASYTSMVPFELRTDDYSLLKRVANSDNSVRSGPTGSANVMCLSCHRAHASGWDSIMRWNMKAEFIVYDSVYPGTDKSVPKEYSQGRLSVETQKTFYDRPATLYAPYQRSLCNKCHGKD